MRLNTLVISFLCAASTADIVTFEDVHGIVRNDAFVPGPGILVIEDVTFQSPEVLSLNAGADYSFPAGLGNPFLSDSMQFYTFDEGLLIDFGIPVVAVRFEAGVTTNMENFPVFRLRSGEHILTTFEASLFEETVVEVTLPEPSNQVRVTFVGGSSSALAIDNLVYERACLPDWSRDGTLDVFDILEFVNDLENGDADADLNEDGSNDIFDVFLFIEAYASGC